MMAYEDAPFHEVAQAAEALVSQGNLVFQKWTCHFCGERITMSIPNRFHRAGRHEDCAVNPNDETNIEKQGCNYMVIQANSLKGRSIIEELLMREDTE